jgi:two-component system response regulator DesR
VHAGIDVVAQVSEGGSVVPAAEAVRNYLAAAVTKLGARNRVDAVRIATGAGWL